jgi:glycosyltransferase involved in cell wall biosynthesis
MEGGVPSTTYWTFKHLAKKGVESIILSDNWCVNEKYRISIKPQEVKNLEPPGVKLYSVDPVYALRYSSDSRKGCDSTLVLLSLSIEALKKEKPSLVYSHYFFPYGMVALFLKLIAPLPLILRHAGSDLRELKTAYSLPLLHLLKNVDLLITRDEELKKVIGKTMSVPPLTVPPEFDIDYKPLERGKIRIGIIGKYDPSKRIIEFCEALSKMDNKYKDQLEVRILSNNFPKKSLSRVFPELRKHMKFLKYIPPWRMPDFYASCDLIYAGEKEFPVPYHLPKIPAEALYVGTPTLLSDEIFGKYKRFLPLEKNKHTLTVDTTDYKSIKNELEKVLEDPALLAEISKKGKNLRSILKRHFKQYIESMYEIFRTFSSTP